MFKVVFCRQRRNNILNRSPLFTNINSCKGLWPRQSKPELGIRVLDRLWRSGLCAFQELPGGLLALVVDLLERDLGSTRGKAQSLRHLLVVEDVFFKRLEVDVKS